jgi:hypothetical protein
MSQNIVQATAFNAGSLPLQVSINNGAPWPIGQASQSLGWLPGIAIGRMQLNAGGVPQPNILGGGDNTIAITPQGAPTPFHTWLSVPVNMQWSSAQIYFFFNGYHSASWMLLNKGNLVTGGNF